MFEINLARNKHKSDHAKIVEYMGLFFLYPSAQISMFILSAGRVKKSEKKIQDRNLCCLCCLGHLAGVIFCCHSGAIYATFLNGR